MNAHARAQAIKHIDEAIRSSRAEKTNLSRSRDYLPAGREDSEILGILSIRAQLERRLEELRERIRESGRVTA